MIFISVNTLLKKGVRAAKQSDSKVGRGSARQISKYAKGFTIVVEKSTLPVKTAETIKQILEADFQESKKVFTVLFNPEFLSEVML